MSMRFEIARATGALSTWALRDVLHRPAANFPGKIGLYVDPQLIADLRTRIREGSVVVVGTNGKTTVTNLLADAFEAAGKTVACNRTGANLDSGVATALLQAYAADWGVFESDELWLAKVVPQLRPDFVVLLNLFRDQLDRMGEIDHIQAAIAQALEASPETTLVYNADDPFCQAVAEQVGNARTPFGFDEDLGLAQNTIADASMCQRCDSLLEYEWRQYGQLGAFHCPNCGFRRERPVYAAHGATVTEKGASFSLRHAGGNATVNVPFAGTYMLYNALAAYAAAGSCGIAYPHVDRAIGAFEPDNGRLQRYEIDGRRVLLNLAKNPTGFNQNLRIVMGEPGPKAAAFFINDKEADGHDVSWLWDVDFQELARAEDLTVFAGGIRRNDMQVRLKYAGIDADLVDGAEDFLEKAGAIQPDASLFLIANYTALPNVKAELDALQHGVGQRAQGRVARFQATLPQGKTLMENGPPCPAHADPPARLVIVHLYPELLNLYGDGGNVAILAERARRRGLEAEIVRVAPGQMADLDAADIVFLGGGPDREQHLASIDLLGQADELRAYVEDDGVLLAICGGYQILGHEWLLGDEAVPGLGILDITTKRAEGGSHNRLVGNIALDSPLATMPVIGYENHAGRTFLGDSCEPFGHVANRRAHGNNDTDAADGALYRNVVGTYLHGPLLAKNPEVADWLIARAMALRAAKEGRPAPSLAPLDDSAERAANDFMRAKLGVPR